MSRTLATVVGIAVVAVAMALAGMAVAGIADEPDGGVASGDVERPDDHETGVADGPTGVADGPTGVADGPMRDGRSVTVRGEGSASAPPDEAVIAVAVAAEGDDPAAVRDELREGAAALREALADAGIEDDQVETVEYRIHEIHPEAEPVDGAEPDPPAYRGVHAFRVTVDEVVRAGAVVDAAAGAGAGVQRVAFTHSDDRRAELRDEALTAAMDDARRQAETLAAAGDLRITGVRRVDADDPHGGPLVYEDAVADEAAADGTALEPGDVTTRATARVTYDAVEAGDTDE